MIANCAGIQEIVSYVEKAEVASVTTHGVTITSTSAPVSVAVPFSNVIHVNFVFTKKMDFVALMATLGK